MSAASSSSMGSDTKNCLRKKTPNAPAAVGTITANKVSIHLRRLQLVGILISLLRNYEVVRAGPSTFLRSYFRHCSDAPLQILKLLPEVYLPGADPHEGALVIMECRIIGVCADVLGAVAFPDNISQPRQSLEVRLGIDGRLGQILVEKAATKLRNQGLEQPAYRRPRWLDPPTLYTLSFELLQRTYELIPSLRRFVGIQATFLHNRFVVVQRVGPHVQRDAVPLPLIGSCLPNRRCEVARLEPQRLSHVVQRHDDVAGSEGGHVEALHERNLWASSDRYRTRELLIEHIPFDGAHLDFDVLVLGVEALNQLHHVRTISAGQPIPKIQLHARP